jgi:hypothetical protein
MSRKNDINSDPYVNRPGVPPDAPAGGGGAGFFRVHRAPGINILGRKSGPFYAQTHGPFSTPAQKHGQPLILYSPEFNRSEIIEFSKKKNHIQAIQKQGDTRIVAVTTWASFASTIKTHSPISLLVLHFHGGTDGTIIVGDSGKEVGGTQVKKLFVTRCQSASCKTDAVVGSRFCRRHRPAGTEPWFGPRVERVLFESCVVGQRPDQLVSFGSLFHARGVSGYTWYHVTSPYNVTFPKGSTAQEIRTLKDKFRKYLLSDTPSDATIAQRCASGQQKIKFFFEWWRKEFSATLPPEIAKSKENPHHFRVLKEVRQRNINSMQVNQLVKEYKNQLLESNAEQVNVIIRY